MHLSKGTQMKSLGEIISIARKRIKMTLEELSAVIGMSKTNLSVIENNGLKGGPDAVTLIRISEALNAPEILIHHCDVCPIRQHIMLRQYPELNNIRRDPAIITARLSKELGEAKVAADDLAERLSDKDFKIRAGYQEFFDSKMEQILDAERNIEILKFELLLSGTHTKEDMDRVCTRQQQKCVERGHHVLDPNEADHGKN
jgi:transcriptional regulator with XRE-family HTH domain